MDCLVTFVHRKNPRNVDQNVHLEWPLTHRLSKMYAPNLSVCSPILRRHYVGSIRCLMSCLGCSSASALHLTIVNALNAGVRRPKLPDSQFATDPLSAHLQPTYAMTVHSETTRSQSSLFPWLRSYKSDNSRAILHRTHNRLSGRKEGILCWCPDPCRPYTFSLPLASDSLPVEALFLRLQFSLYASYLQPTYAMTWNFLCLSARFHLQHVSRYNCRLKLQWC